MPSLCSPVSNGLDLNRGGPLFESPGSAIFFVRVHDRHCNGIHSSLNPFPNRPWFLLVCSTRLLKTLWEKEKLLVTSNLPFSHSVFNPFEDLSSIFIKFEIVVCKLFQFGRVKNLSFGKGLMLTIVSLMVMMESSQRLRKIIAQSTGKKGNPGKPLTSNFSFSHGVFYPFGELSTNFIKFETVVCKLFQFGLVQKMSFGKGLKHVQASYKKA